MQNTSLFSYDGRIGRWNYFLLNAVALFIFTVLSITIFSMIAPRIPEVLLRKMAYIYSANEDFAVSIFTIPIIIISSSYTIRRWRDILPSPWATKKILGLILILEFVPYLGIAIHLIALFLPGGTYYHKLIGNKWLESIANKNQRQKHTVEISLNDLELKADSIIKQALHDHYDDENAVHAAMAKYEAQLKYYFPGETDETYQNALKASLLRIN